MKRFILFFAIAMFSLQSAHAIDVSGYFDQGTIYSNSRFPIDVAKNSDDKMTPNENLKVGEATTNNILGIIEIGDRSIQAAAKNGGITKIDYVDMKINKVYIPLLFVPIYVKQTKTLVYGE